jgi:hypothetical protein
LFDYHGVEVMALKPSLHAFLMPPAGARLSPAGGNSNDEGGACKERNKNNKLEEILR